MLYRYVLLVITVLPLPGGPWSFDSMDEVCVGAVALRLTHPSDTGPKMLYPVESNSFSEQRKSEASWP